jgi:hypothetical protein
VIKRDEMKVVVDRMSVMQKEVTHLMVLLNESLKLNLMNPKDGSNILEKEAKTCEVIS